MDEYVNNIHHNDAINFLTKLPDNSIDVVITDPPYNFDTSGTNWDNKNWEIYERGGEMDWDTYEEFTFQWLGEVDRVLREDGSVWLFGTYHNTPFLNLGIRKYGKIINEISWIKRNAFPNIRQSRLAASHETIYWGSMGGNTDEYYFNYERAKKEPFTTDSFTSEDTQLRTIWDIPTNKSSVELDYNHPAQKPLRLLDRIILIGTNENDVILDPFTGSGAIPVSAKLNNRDYIGVEIDDEYVSIARKYLDNIETKPEIVTKELQDDKETKLEDF